MIAKCTCKHEFQDERHGKGMRVFNVAIKDKNTMRCTVCEKVKPMELFLKKEDSK